MSHPTLRIGLVTLLILLVAACAAPPATPATATAGAKIAYPVTPDSTATVPSTRTRLSETTTHVPLPAASTALFESTATPTIKPVTPKPKKTRPTQAASPTTDPVEWGIFPGYNPPSETTTAIFQTFERGFMVWRSDYNCVYAIQDINIAMIPKGNEYDYCLTLAPLTDETLTRTPPPGFLRPTGPLGKVWNYYAIIADDLGYATGPEIQYTAATVTQNQDYLDSISIVFQMTLPDGKALVCGMVHVTSHRCNPAP